MDSEEPPRGPLRVLVATWNVGNAEPVESELAEWLPKDNSFDVIAVGTQECSYHKGKHKPADGDEEDEEDEDDIIVRTMTGLSAAGVDVSAPPPRLTSHASAHNKQRHKEHHHGHGQGGDAGADGGAAPAGKGSDEDDDNAEGFDKNRLGHWETMLADRLGVEFEVVELVVLRHMRLIVFARAEHVHGFSPTISGVQCASSATGIGGVVGNKGGLVIKLSIRGTTLAFVSSHLAAHTQFVDHRNADFREIVHETRRHIGHRELDVLSEFDHVVWMGDLNYRVDLNHGRNPPPHPDNDDHHAAVCALAENKEWGALLEADQLRCVMREGGAFYGFQEGDIAFPPSYKVERCAGTKYERKKMRIPSYCDRILWRSMPHLRDSVRQVRLSSAPGVSTSDHKPVYAHFEIDPTPQVPVRTDAELVGAPVVQITKLQANNLAARDSNGKSDPYCVFHTSPPGLLGKGSQPPKTKVVRKTLDPVWSHRDVPLLRPAVRAGADLAHVSLIVRLYDHDYLTHDDSLGAVVIPLGGQPARGGAGGATYTLEATEPVLHNGVPTGVLAVAMSVSYGTSVNAGIINHKQAIAAAPKRSERVRERGASFVTTNLPKTIKLLVASLDKASAQLVLKYTKRQNSGGGVGGSGRPSGSGGGGAAAGAGAASAQINDLDLFLESLGAIVGRMKSRIQSHPDKVSKLLPPSELHATLVRVIYRLVPTAWLWEEHPAYAARHVDIIEAILFKLGVNRWDWEVRADRADFVPVLLTILVMRTSGEPIREPRLATRLVTALLKAGATSGPYGNVALVARAKQCGWAHVSALLEQLDVEGSELRTMLDYHESRPSVSGEPSAASSAAAAAAASAAASAKAGAGAASAEEKAAEDEARARDAASAAKFEQTVAEKDRATAEREAAERAANEAEARLRAARAASETAERERLEMVRRMSVVDADDGGGAGSDDDDVESDEEDDAVLQMDTEELVQRELARLRANIPSLQSISLAEEEPSGFGADADAGSGSDSDGGGGGSDSDSDDDDDDDVFSSDARRLEGDNPEARLDRVINRLKAVIPDFRDDAPEDAEVGSNHVLSTCIKSLRTSELTHKTDGESLLMAAVNAQKPGVIAMLVYAGALSHRAAQKEGNREFFLHQVARQAFDERVTPVTISILCAAGLSCEDKDDEGATAIDVAASNADPRVATAMRQIEFEAP